MTAVWCRCSAPTTRATPAAPHSEVTVRIYEHDIEILCDLRQAHGEAMVLTTDLSHAYIDENRRTS